MAVIFLFDSGKTLKRPIREGVQEIIHSEGEYTAIAQLLARDMPEYGDSFGFRCADGRFRIFEITEAEINDEAGICMITGVDAAIAELDSSILPTLPLKSTTAAQAIAAALDGTGWTIGSQTADGDVNTEDVYFASRWTAIKTAAAAGGVRVVPYYEMAGNAITAKRVDIIARKQAFSGLIYTSKRGAQNIHILRAGMPYGRVYPIGKIIGSGDPPEQVTIAEAVWSTANGDPADKPAGQLYVDFPGAKSTAAYVYEDKREEDPLRLMEKGFEDLAQTQKPTASGTANLTDMQRLPGYEHMIAQMWMTAVICSESGEKAEATIVDIERYHVHTELTKITIGDEKNNAETLENQLSDMQAALIDAARVAGGGSAGAGQAKQMVLQAEELIQIMSERVEIIAEEIQLRATSAEVLELENETITRFNEVQLSLEDGVAAITALQTDVNNLDNEVNEVSAELSVQAGLIAAAATKTEVDELGENVSTVSANLDALNTTVNLHAQDIKTINDTLETIGGVPDVTGLIKRISAVEVALNGDETTIGLTAKVTENDEEISRVALLLDGAEGEAGLVARVGEAESRITANEKSITSKVSEDDFETSVEQLSSQIASKVTQTDFNALGKRVSDAESTITQQANQIASKVTQTDFNALGKRVSDAESTITQQANQIASKVTQTDFNALGKRVSDAESTITQQANQIASKVTQTDFNALGKRVSDAESTINQQAGSITAITKTLDGQGDRIASAELILNGGSGAAGLISRVEDAESSIIAQGDTLKAKADLILLDGYVKTGDFESETLKVLEEARIADLKSLAFNCSGTGTISTLYVGTGATIPSLVYKGTLLDHADLTMGDVVSAKILNGGSDINLAHSHAVTVNDDGTITLGEVSSSGGSFRIADTAYYKNGVSAAKKSVTLSSAGWIDGVNVVKASNDEECPVLLPDFKTSGGTSWTSDHKTNVFFATDSVTGPLATVTVDAGSVYTDGADSVTLAQTGWIGRVNTVTASNNAAETVYMPNFSAPQTDWNTNHQKYVAFQYTGADGLTDIVLNELVDATDVYNSVGMDVVGWTTDVGCLVEADNGAQAWVGAPGTYAEVVTDENGEIWGSANVAAVKYGTYAKSAADGYIAVDASPVYEKGRNSVTLEQTGWIGKINEVWGTNDERETVNLPTFYTEIDDWNSLNKTNVYIKYKDANNKEQSATFVTVDASSVYTAGQNAAYADAETGVSAGGIGISGVHLGGNRFRISVSGKLYLFGNEVDNFSSTQEATIRLVSET